MRKILTLAVVLAVCGCSSRTENFTENEDHKSFVQSLATYRNHPVTQPAYRIDNLYYALSDVNPTVRNNAMMDLKALAKNDVKAVKALEKVLSLNDATLRREAATTLGKIGVTATPELIDNLIDAAEFGNDRLGAIKALENYSLSNEKAAKEYKRLTPMIQKELEATEFRKKIDGRTKVTKGNHKESPEEYKARLAKQDEEAKKIADKVNQDIIKQYGSLESYNAKRDALIAQETPEGK